MGKRGNGEGSISKRKDGRWSGRYTVHTKKSVYGKTRYVRRVELGHAVD